MPKRCLCTSCISSRLRDRPPLGHVDKVSLSRPSKWTKHSAMVNEKRRSLYKQNPMKKRLSNQRYYHSHPEIHSQRVLHAYHNAPQPVKEMAKPRVRDAYAIHPSPIRQKARERARKSDLAIPTEKQQRNRAAYRNNPIPIKHRILAAYKLHPSLIKC